MAYSTDLEKNIPKMYMEQKKTPHSLSNLEKEEQSWRYLTTYCQTILHGHCNENSLVLT